MKLTFTIKSKYLVTHKEKEQLETLHFKDGFMWPFFRNKKKLGFVILAIENNKIVAWGLVFERRGNKTFFVYCRKSHRRLGISTKIWKIATEYFGPDLAVSRHDKASKTFYDSLSD